jgi:hypothetical protein
MTSTTAFELRLDALQTLNGEEAHLSASQCIATCAMTCQTTCFITG